MFSVSLLKAIAGLKLFLQIVALILGQVVVVWVLGDWGAHMLYTT